VVSRSDLIELRKLNPVKKPKKDIKPKETKKKVTSKKSKLE